MHRVIQDHLEEVLAETQSSECDPRACSELVRSHLKDCEECRGEVDEMLAQARVLREMRASPEQTGAEPRPGFYARVMERIEAEGAISIWNVFSESPFGRRIAVASMALVVLAGVFLYAFEPATDQAAGNPTVEFISGQLPDSQPVPALKPSGQPDRDAVLVNLVTYQEQ
jgi:anti-sigma factor RsiW